MLPIGSAVVFSVELALLDAVAIVGKIVLFFAIISVVVLGRGVLGVALIVTGIFVVNAVDVLFLILLLLLVRLLLSCYEFQGCVWQSSTFCSIASYW